MVDTLLHCPVYRPLPLLFLIRGKLTYKFLQSKKFTTCFVIYLNILQSVSKVDRYIASGMYGKSGILHQNPRKANKL